MDQCNTDGCILLKGTCYCKERLFLNNALKIVYLIYPFFNRYMFFLKRKVRNKNRVEGSISAQYIYEEVATFCSRYFSSEVETMHNRAQRNDDLGDEEQDDIFSIFCSSVRPFGKAKERLLTQKEKDAAELYVLDNCQEVEPFVEYFFAIFLDMSIQ